MESPVVVDKPTEYHGSAGNKERGFPFDEEEGSGAWSELAARHPDIAARLRQRPATATWARKRRPSSQDAEDFGDNFGGFDRFPFDDIPPEFREHFPSHWNRRFGSREEQAEPQPQASQSPPQQHTAATQTERHPPPPPPPPEQTLPQYGLRNTVDLGQKSPADPSLVDADERNQRSMSAPPDNRTSNQTMSGQNQEQQPRAEQQSSNVRVIPIVVEGRDQPVINKSVDHGTHFGENKPTYVPPPQQPHIDREQYFTDDGPVGYVHPPNFSRSFGAPYSKFRQGPQPFVHQKVYPQSATAFARGASPQRSQSPKPAHLDEHFVKVPVHHEQAAPKPEPPSRQQPKPPQPQPKPPQPQPKPQQQQQQQQPPQQPPPQQPSPPPQPKPQPSPNDPITQILAIQTDVLNLMTEVENFKGTKKDKEYMFLDEMLTRNLIKLDNIETDGKENIRLARKEAIKCIQKCIAVLEAKADGRGSAPSQTQEVEMQNSEQSTAENGEVAMEEPKEEAKVESQSEQPQEEKIEDNKEPQSDESKDAAPEAADTRPGEKAEQNAEAKPEQNEVENKPAPKKGTKNVKKRDKSKENAAKDSKSEATAPENDQKVETMQVDDKGDKPDSQTMEVDTPSQ